MPANTDALHTHAVQAEKHLEQLATGLGQVGADDATVKAFSQMAEACRQVAKGLAKNMRDEEPPAEKQQPRTMDEAADQMMAERKAAQPAE